MHAIARRAIEGHEPIAMLVADFYGATGPLAAAGWEVRPQQREMSLRLAAQIDHNGGSIGLIEAPTGTGKGMAYLLPGVLAALRAEKRWYDNARAEARRKGKDPDDVEPSGSDYPAKLVVSTANIALQSQLVNKDIPALARMLGLEIRARLMKSRSNYACYEEMDKTLQRGPDPEVSRILSWVRAGGSGDKEHVTWPVAEAWPRASRGTDDCLGESCAHWDGGKAALCTWRAAVDGWFDAHVLVANHHWAALSGGIAAVAYAIDEAHELEEALRSVQGHRVMIGNFSALAARYAALIKADDGERRTIEARVNAASAPLFEVLEARMESTRNSDEEHDAPVLLPIQWVRRSQGERLELAFASLLQLRDDIAQSALDRGCLLEDARIRYVLREDTEIAKEGRAAASVANRAIALCRLYGAVVLGRPHPDWRNPAPWAIWAQVETDRRGQKRLVANLVPADVAPVFAGLYQRYGTMLLTSATLPAFPSLRLGLGMGVDVPPRPPAGWPMAWRTGVGKLRGQSLDVAEGYDSDDRMSDELDDNVLTMSAAPTPEPLYEVRLPSPYPLRQLGILVVPRGPLPTESGWRDWAVEQVVAAVRASGGGALVLASSVAMMRRYAEALRRERVDHVGGWTVLCQGEGGRTQLVADFKADKDSVLCATRSFFAGLDVQGDACRLVIIDRIPFAGPDDPVENAVGRLLVERNRGGNAWRLRSVPQAAMVLVQGIGRLVRSATDRGAAMVLDGRVLDGGSGWRQIRSALPPFPLMHDIAEIRRHLGRD